MESQLRKSILFDVIDGIPPSGNESKAVMNYRNDIEQSHLTLEEEAMRLWIIRDVIEFTEDLDRCPDNLLQKLNFLKHVTT